jgi:hypothetical protein
VRWSKSNQMTDWLRWDRWSKWQSYFLHNMFLNSKCPLLLKSSKCPFQTEMKLGLKKVMFQWPYRFLQYNDLILDIR